jgi:hypothetical protein
MRNPKTWKIFHSERERGKYIAVKYVCLDVDGEIYERDTHARKICVEEMKSFIGFSCHKKKMKNFGLRGKKKKLVASFCLSFVVNGMRRRLRSFLVFSLAVW